MFMYSNRSYLPNGVRKLLMSEPLYGGTNVPGTVSSISTNSFQLLARLAN